MESNELIEGMLWEVKSVEFVSGLYAGGKERGINGSISREALSCITLCDDESALYLTVQYGSCWLHVAIHHLKCD